MLSKWLNKREKCFGINFAETLLFSKQFMKQPQKNKEKRWKKRVIFIFQKEKENILIIMHKLKAADISFMTLIIWLAPEEKPNHYKHLKCFLSICFSIISLLECTKRTVLCCYCYNLLLYSHIQYMLCMWQEGRLLGFILRAQLICLE